jgi:hypothetical protein
MNTMETQEALNNLTTTLVAEGLSDEEIKQRVQTLKECIEFGETMSAKIKAKKEAQAAKKAKPRVTIRETIEWCLLAFVTGMLAGSLLYQYAEANQ